MHKFPPYKNASASQTVIPADYPVSPVSTRLSLTSNSCASSATDLGRKRSVGGGRWRNTRSVWTVATTPFSGAHYAVFPRKLIEPCILAGSNPGHTVLDVFAGSTTTGQVATDLGRSYIGCELNSEYVRLEELRRTTLGMPL